MKKFNKASAIIPTVVLGLLCVFGLVKLATAAPTVSLGTANSFAVLAYSAISNTGNSVIVGDVGLSPTSGSFITGFPPAVLTGSIYAVDNAGPAGSTNNPGLLTSAMNALDTAYTTAANATPATTLAGGDNQLGGQTLNAGIYSFGHATTANLTAASPLVLDGQNNPNAVFIFQASSDLIMASASQINLVNGAQACNIFWQVGSAATLGTGSHFAGTLMAQTSITDNGGSTVNGRLLVRTAAVTLNNTTITVSSCAPALTLLKTVTNDNAGTAAATAWTLTATGAGGSPTNLSGTTPVNSDVAFSDASFKADTYTLGETGGPSGYTPSTYSCVINGGAPVVSNTITLARGDIASCTINNNDNVPTPTPPSPVVNNDRGEISGGGFPLGIAPVVVVPPPPSVPTVPARLFIIPTLPKTGFAPGATPLQRAQSIESTLMQGNRGRNVKTLQQFLIAEHTGPKTDALELHGTTQYFGPLTAAALAEWQEKAGIVPSLGIFGATTRAYLKTQ